MVHYGKHIIDHQTGLCEICDRGAIHELRHGKRTGKQFLYTNHDGKFTYRPNNNNEDYYPEQPHQHTPRYVRKPLYPEPPPSIRQRQAEYEEPPANQQKFPRRAHSPVDEPHPRLTTLYYVDNSGQMYPRHDAPIQEPRPAHPVQHHPPPPPPPPQHHQPRPHPTRTVHQRARTPPPPPASDTWRAPPQRQNKSDTEILPQQSHRAPPHPTHYEHSPRRIELFHIARAPEHDRFTTLGSLVPAHVDSHPSPPRNHPPKQRQLEPIEPRRQPEPEQTFVRKVYHRSPPKRVERHEDEYIPNEYHPQTARKAGKYHPSPRTYDSTPQLSQRQFPPSPHSKYPSTYHIHSDYN